MKAVKESSYDIFQALKELPNKITAHRNSFFKINGEIRIF